MKPDIKFMNHALTFARIALNRGDFPVGCVLTLNHEIIATGERTGTDCTIKNELDHAEINALRKFGEYCPRDEINVDQLTLYCTLEPCLMCFGAILIHRIPRIVYAFEDAMGGGTTIPQSLMPPLYANQTIEIVSGVCRQESLDLFKIFFSNPDNNYLADTDLADYVLKQ